MSAVLGDPWAELRNAIQKTRSCTPTRTPFRPPPGTCCRPPRHTDPGGDYFTRRDPERLVAQLERLGRTVTLKEAAVT
ncbi:MAG TPA: hypothetical protein VGV40_10250 [Solirubrobacteraceae bacterium]|nr:hypothetical protein [Solirubrobacteraceae bacterium]